MFDAELHRKISHLSGININIRGSFTNTSIEKQLGRNNHFRKLKKFRTKNEKMLDTSVEEKSPNNFTTMNSDNAGNVIQSVPLPIQKMTRNQVLSPNTLFMNSKDDSDGKNRYLDLTSHGCSKISRNVQN